MRRAEPLLVTVHPGLVSEEMMEKMKEEMEKLDPARHVTRSHHYHNNVIMVIIIIGGHLFPRLFYYAPVPIPRPQSFLLSQAKTIAVVTMTLY